MTEVFIIVSGQAEIRINDEADILLEGDAVVIPAQAAHTLTALGDAAVHDIAMGIVHGAGGRTIVASA